MADVNAAFWEDLLEYIDDGRVIPVVGSELSWVEQSGHRTPLSLWLATRLADRLGVAGDAIPEDNPLHAVICRYLSRNGRREDIYPRLRSLLRDAVPPPSSPLLQLASIRHFNLFVTTSFDPLLEQAVNTVRSEGPRSLALGYSPGDVQDIPRNIKQAGAPIVYHLLGKLSSLPDYAVTDEDMLEFLCALQVDQRRPRLLFDELRTNHLLLIGTRFPDWLARFFIRLVKGNRLSTQRDSSEVLADLHSARDENLVLFLKNFSYRTHIYPSGGAEQFVEELARRYAQRHPAGVAPALASADAPPEMPDGAVFISYASEDRPAAMRLHDSLHAAGIDVWLDRRQLEAGDEYTVKIRRHIKTCSLFVPLVSANTQARLEGYFRQEWNWAVERTQQIDPSVPFILPVLIDETPRDGLRVPAKFHEVHFTHLEDGAAVPAFCERLKCLVREYRKRRRGAPVEASIV